MKKGWCQQSSHARKYNFTSCYLNISVVPEFMKSATGSQHIWGTGCWVLSHSIVVHSWSRVRVRHVNCCGRRLRCVSTPWGAPHRAFISPQSHLVQRLGVPQATATRLRMSDKGRPNSQYPEHSLVWSGPVWRQLRCLARLGFAGIIRSVPPASSWGPSICSVVTVHAKFMSYVTSSQTFFCCVNWSGDLSFKHHFWTRCSFSG